MRTAGAKPLKPLDYRGGERRPASSPECPFLSSSPPPAEPPGRPSGPLRHVLRLIVEVDESRLQLRRIRAAVLLLGLVLAFGLTGYGLAALFAPLF